MLEVKEDSMLLGPSCYLVPSFCQDPNQKCFQWNVGMFGSWSYSVHDRFVYVLFPNLGVPFPSPPPNSPPTLFVGYLSIYDLYLKVLMFKQMLTF
jgi:hypothetical protein